MKKIVFLLCMVAFSCTNDDNNNQENLENEQLQLISRIINYYVDDSLENTTEEFYENGKLKRSQVTDGGYSLYTYTGALVSTIDFYDQNGILATSLEYTYDINERLTSRFSIPGPGSGENQIPFERTYRYENSKVTGIKQFYDQQFMPISTDTIWFDVNPAGQITKSEKIDAFQGSWGAEVRYQENIVSSFEYYGWRTDFEGVVEYTYSDKDEVNIFSKSKILFGQNWITNQILDDASVLNHTSFGAADEKYLTGHKHWNKSKTVLKSELTINHEFDEFGNQTKSTYIEENFVFDQVFKYTIVYQYQ